MTMPSRGRVAAGLFALLLAGLAAPDLQAAARQEPNHPAVSNRTLIERYCVTCHNARLRTAGLVLSDMDLDQVAGDAEQWEKVVRKLRAEAMPPAGRPRPANAEYAALASWLESALDRAAAERPPAPRPFTVHRLNRIEYGNAVRDLLGVEVDTELLLPPDDDDEGFDNIADVLSVSPTLMERYLFAARRISRLAVGDPQFAAASEIHRVPEALVQDERIDEDLPFGSRGGAAIRHYFPLDGEYSIRIRLQRSFYDVVRGLGTVPHQLDVRVDGALVERFTVGGEHAGPKPPASHSGNTRGDQAWETYSHHADDNLVARAPVKAGLRVVGVSFVKRPAVPEGVLQPPRMLATFGASTDELMDGNPAVRSVEIDGPFGGAAPRETPARERIFICQPAAGNGADAEARCAERILSRLARRAYRRPVAAQDVETLRSFYAAGRAAGGFEGGIQAALERMLVDPEFLFRIEREPGGGAGSRGRVSDIELASRLSFFLWSSIPDDELLDLAAENRLGDAETLERQVRRMLADPRSAALVSNFAAQWLQLRQLRNASPDATVFPEFDENLRRAMQRETTLFLESQLREDRNVVDLLRADYTFVNERLARHYGIPDIRGNHFRRVPVADGNRPGLLGQGSILTLTSYPNRTSPVLRGKWVLENILSSPPPPPPPDVPALEERDADGNPRSVREQLREHRRNPACAGCHNAMDPIGFALENYDAIGRWRTIDMTGVLEEPPAGAAAPGSRIDPSGSLPGGAAFAGPAGLRSLLLERQDEFVATVAERLLMYALGRPVAYYDMPAVRQVLREAAGDGNRWSSIIVGIVRSTPFQMRRSES